MNTTTSLSYVYDGRRCIGHVIGRGKPGFEAFSTEDKSLGFFPSAKEAANALTAVSTNV
jgi:hypothetical protein